MPFSFHELVKKRRGLASGAMITTAAVVLSTLALTYEGITTADLELDDGGVWVTKTNDLLVGHLNHPSHVLDGAARVRPGDFDVLQHGDTVMVHSLTDGVVTAVDPATVTLGEELALPAEAHLALGGNTLAVLGDGMLFTAAAGALAQANLDPEAGLAEIGEGAIAVTNDGSRVFAVSATDAVLRSFDVAIGAAAGNGSTTPGTVTETGSITLNELADDAELALTVVGDQAVALDERHGVLYLPNGTAVELPDGVGAKLQQPGAADAAVIVATPTGLLRQPLDGGAFEIIAEAPKGDPAAPVRLGACTYAVWSDSARYVRDCAGEADDLAQSVKGSSAQSDLVLRTNRRVVVINDMLTGAVWLVDQQMMKVDNWEDVIPPPAVESDQEESEEEEPQFELPERSADNRPPTAVDDEYGVRAGRTT